MNIYMSFTSENILKLLANPPLKWQTRRLMREQPDPQTLITILMTQPAQRGDVLCVLENYSLSRPDDSEQCVVVQYRADCHFEIRRLTDHEWACFLARKKPGAVTPGRYMYRSLSRIRRPILSVHPEWLQDITEEDAVAEGVGSVAEYAELWDSIHPKPGPRDKKKPTRWADNPGVWVYEVEKGAKHG